MVRINEPSSGHGNFTSAAGNRYWVYSNAKALDIVKKALWILKHNIKGMKPCNERFTRLPGGKSFDDILADDTVWINYESRTDRDWYGITLGVGGKEISISQSAINEGRWRVAGTLVHELAHVNGAPGNTGDADDTKLYCGLKSTYHGAIGFNESGTNNEIGIA